jgi:uncharacterized membrane protein
MEIMIVVLIALVIVFGPLISALVALARVKALRERVEELEVAVGRLSAAAPPAALWAAARPDPAPEQTPEPEPEPTPEPKPAPEPEATRDPAKQPEATRDPAKQPEATRDPAKQPEATRDPAKQPEATRDPAKQPAMAARQAADMAVRTAPAPAPKLGMEEALTSRWMVWLGAGAVALSAVFLFGYVIEHGYLSPAVRVASGLALGLALIASGEWLGARARRAAPPRP